MDKKASKSFKEYYAKVKNIEGILANISKIMDVKGYEEELRLIKKDMESDDSFNYQMTNSNMQFDYEMHNLSSYIKRLDSLADKIEDEVYGFYEIYLLTSKISSDLSDVNEKSIIEVINDTKKLINLMNNAVTHNNKDLERVLSNSYKVIYDVILTEEMFNRSDVLLFITNSQNRTHIENIGRLLASDLKKINQYGVIKDALTGIKKEGIGYDFLSMDVVREVSSEVFKKKNKLIATRKREEQDKIIEGIIELQQDKKMIDEDIKKKKELVTNLRINKGLFAGAIAIFVLMPIVGFTTGKRIGTAESNKIDEYKTITRTVNLKTKEMIGEIEEVYDEHVTTYVATIKECSPWRNDRLGGGYIRDVVTYEYHAFSELEEVDVNELINNSVIKYRYCEAKEELDDSDSLTDKEILITETYQDKSDSRKSTKYIIPGILVGSVLGFGVDALIYLLAKYQMIEFSDIFDTIAEKSNMIKNRDEYINSRLAKLKKEALAIKEKSDEIIEIYGPMDDMQYLDILKKLIVEAKGKRKVLK